MPENLMGDFLTHTVYLLSSTGHSDQHEFSAAVSRCASGQTSSPKLLNPHAALDLRTGRQGR